MCLSVVSTEYTIGRDQRVVMDDVRARDVYNWIAPIATRQDLLR